MSQNKGDEYPGNACTMFRFECKAHSAIQAQAPLTH